MTTTATLDTCDGFVFAAAPALTSQARVIVRTVGDDPGSRCRGALALFRAVNAACSRFDPDSELRRVNAEPGAWHVVGETFHAALREAWWAHRKTSGEFDPRMHPPAATRRSWHPRFAEVTRRVHLGGVPVDLDSVARGLALRWAGRALRESHHLLQVGDDCWCGGLGPDGAPWRVGLYHPLGAASPLAVLSLSDTACVTTTFARARVAGQAVGTGVLAVTVVGPDAVAAEVWSMVLLRSRGPHIADVCRRRRLPAAWVTDDGELHTSPALESKILWRS